MKDIIYNYRKKLKSRRKVRVLHSEPSEQTIHLAGAESRQDNVVRSSPSLVSSPLPRARHWNDSPKHAKSPQRASKKSFALLIFLTYFQWRDRISPFIAQGKLECVKYERESRLHQNQYCQWGGAWDIRAFYEIIYYTLGITI